MEYDSLDDFRQRAGYEIDGRWYPRVTSIVSIKAKPALYRYYAGMPSFKAADEVKERSAAEGSAVHAAAEAILQGHDMQVPEAIRPSIEAFSSFLQNTHVKPLLVEHRLHSPEHGYAGTIDVLAEINGTVGVLDIKTGVSVYRDYGLQTAAYAWALRENASLPQQPTTSWVIRLDQSRLCADCGATLRDKGGRVKVRGGTYRCRHEWGPVQGVFEFLEIGHTEADFKGFLAAKALWEWEHQHYLEQLAAKV